MYGCLMDNSASPLGWFAETNLIPASPARGRGLTEQVHLEFGPMNDAAGSSSVERPATSNRVEYIRLDWAPLVGSEPGVGYGSHNILVAYCLLPADRSLSHSRPWQRPVTASTCTSFHQRSRSMSIKQCPTKVIRNRAPSWKWGVAL